MATGDHETRAARTAQSTRRRQLSLRVGERIRELQTQRSVCADLHRELDGRLRRMRADLAVATEDCEDLAAQLDGAKRRLARLDAEVLEEQEQCTVREIELSSVDRRIDRLTRESELLHTEFVDHRSALHRGRARCQSAVGAVHRMDHKLRTLADGQPSSHRDDRQVVR